MAELIPLRDFFVEHGGKSKEDFLEQYDGAFFLVRFQGMPPSAVFLAREEGFKLTLGSDEDADLPFEMDQTLDESHATVTYHPGFRGWTVEDHDTSFGTMVDGERISRGRTHLLGDRSVLKPGGGLAELQLYTAESLWERMRTSGITRRLGKGSGD